MARTERLPGGRCAKPPGAAATTTYDCGAQGLKLGQLALEWVAGKGQDFGSYSSKEDKKYLAVKAAAAEITLTPDEVKELEHAVPQDEVVGVDMRSRI
jgi:aryl-alcohol dehydrogenase-like predicted oxidoreductase